MLIFLEFRSLDVAIFFPFLLYIEEHIFHIDAGAILKIKVPVVYVESEGAVQLFRRSSSVCPFDPFQSSFTTSYFILRQEF